MRLARAVALLLLGVAATADLRAQASPRDSLDAFVQAQMARRHIAGLSLAIIEDGRIIVARGYGVTDETSRAPVTPATLFQAGSISKPVAALGALHLVEAGRLSLDADVNTLLTSWRVPDNGFTRAEKVTLRRLLSHSAGLTVHGFPGYAVTDRVPTVVQVLDGAAPANTAPIRVDTTPGAIWRYSGGGFTVMQQMVVDVTRTPFPRFMQETVLGPIGMTSSSYEQPLPEGRAALTASGYFADRTQVPGRWHLYPEMAAAGLWTTAGDLARFVIEIQETLAGRGRGVISPAMARQYVTVQKGSSGLGIAVRGTGAALAFSHGGRDEGFDAQMIGLAEGGRGAVVMINANDDSRFMGRLLDFVVRAYGWPAGVSQSGTPAATRGVRLDPARLAAYAGYYELGENQMVTLVPNQDGTGLETLADGLPDESFLALDSVRFGSSERNLRIAFAPDARGAVTAVVWRAGEAALERRVSRVVPLPSSRTPASDPDPALTGRITAALNAMRQGGPALRDAPGIPQRTKDDFAGGIGTALDGLRAIAWLGDEDVTGRRIHRHGSDLARVRYYRVTTDAGLRYLLVHLTAEGHVADYDVVLR